MLIGVKFKVKVKKENNAMQHTLRSLDQHKHTLILTLTSKRKRMKVYSCFLLCFCLFYFPNLHYFTTTLTLTSPLQKPRHRHTHTQSRSSSSLYCFFGCSCNFTVCHYWWRSCWWCSFSYTPFWRQWYFPSRRYNSSRSRR